MNRQPQLNDARLPCVQLETLEKSNPTLQQMLALFRNATGLDAYLYYQDPTTAQWRLKSFSDDLRLPQVCRLQLQHPQGSLQCATCHQLMVNRAISRKCINCLYCHAGLISVHSPLHIDQNSPGCIKTVCAATNTNTKRLNLLEDKLRMLGIAQSKARQAINRLCILSRPQLEEAGHWLELIAGYLTEVSRNCFEHADLSKDRSVPELDDASDIELLLRNQIGQSLPLPKWRGERCSGFSAALFEAIIKFLERHYRQSLSSGVIAQALGFEASYFARMFKLHAMQSFTTTLKQIRLRQAKKLLRNPQLSVLEIAHKSGFNDPAYFASIFRKAYGETPSQFRIRSSGMMLED